MIRSSLCRVPFIAVLLFWVFSGGRLISSTVISSRGSAKPVLNYLVNIAETPSVSSQKRSTWNFSRIRHRLTDFRRWAFRDVGDSVLYHNLSNIGVISQNRDGRKPSSGRRE
jgi:hypothetical protein